jgi:hypothetical protein
MTTLYLVHAATKRRFQVLLVDKEARKIRLKGEHAEFDEVYDPPTFKKLGYTIEKVEADE